jgi:hypothetical protein
MKIPKSSEKAARDSADTMKRLRWRAVASQSKGRHAPPKLHYRGASPERKLAGPEPRSRGFSVALGFSHRKLHG